MISKRILPVLLVSTVLAVSASGSASAHERGGDNGLAVVAGVIGAVAVGSIIANAVTPVYAPAPTVYQAAPQPVYYQPAPVYVQAPPVYVAPPVYAEREYRPHRYYRDGYRDADDDR